MANMAIPKYAHIQTAISFSVLTLYERCPNNIAQGNATICVTSYARSSPVLSSPSAEPYAVAISIIVYTPSI